VFLGNARPRVAHRDADLLLIGLDAYLDHLVGAVCCTALFSRLISARRSWAFSMRASASPLTLTLTCASSRM
jgi:hypothetical protein